MSLDVYLTTPTEVAVEPVPRIYVREGGSTREISRAEWDERFPGAEPVTVTAAAPSEVYSANITHNLNRMAEAAGIYEACWRPEEIGVSKAGQLVPLLRAGLDRLLADPDKFKAFNPSNGWGDYDGFVRWVAAYLSACEQYPDADVSVSR